MPSSRVASNHFPRMPDHASASSSLLAAHQHVADGVEWRVVHPAAEANFLFVEAVVVVRGGELDGVVVGKKCLQHNFAGSIAAPRASRNLGE